LKTETGITMNTYHNFLLMKSTRDDIRRHRDYLPFSLSRLLPVPADLVMLDKILLDFYWTRRPVEKEIGFGCALDWKRHNWGVTSDVTDVFEREGDTNYWAIKFGTTGCPPTNAIRRFSETNPSVHLCHKYFNTAQSTAGNVVYDNGEMKQEKNYFGQSYLNLVSGFQKKGLHINKEYVAMAIYYTDKQRNAGTTDVFSAVFSEYNL